MQQVLWTPHHWRAKKSHCPGHNQTGDERIACPAWPASLHCLQRGTQQCVATVPCNAARAQSLYEAAEW